MMRYSLQTMQEGRAGRSGRTGAAAWRQWGTGPARAMATALAALAVALCVGCAPTAEPVEGVPFPRPGETFLFLGDSITQDGRYVAYIDAYLHSRFPDQDWQILGLGLSSETASGLTEPDHPYPRPCIHDRLDRVLERVQPAVVSACYGMNDGIYHPNDEERFAPYRDGILRLARQARATGAETVLLTPPIYDPVPVAARGTLQPPGAPEYGYSKPYRDYDEVLKMYGQWILDLDDPAVGGAVDLHGPMTAHTLAQRETDPAYTLARDGVHPDVMGHILMAQAILSAWRLPREVDGADVDAAARTVTRGLVAGWTVGADGAIAFEWTTRVPLWTDWGGQPDNAIDREVVQRFNTLQLRIRNLAPGTYALCEGDHEVGRFTAQEFAEGVDVLSLEGLSLHDQSRDLMERIHQRHNVYDAALRNDIGHTLPMHGTPLSLADARQQVAPLDDAIASLRQPARLRLRLVPVDAVSGE